MRTLIAVACVAAIPALVACKPSSKGSLSCHVAVQQVCDEYPAPSPSDDENVGVACSSRSGVLARPAACPSAGFLGKCTTGSGSGQHIQRFYTGADAAYSQDFCANTAHGAWSTAF